MTPGIGVLPAVFVATAKGANPAAESEDPWREQMDRGVQQ